jgi:hypothetical protein
LRSNPTELVISLDEIRRAQSRIEDVVMRTPLVRLEVDAPCEIWLKLECLQPIGSFKLRGALSAVRAASSSELADGVVTASAGNMAQGVAWAAREAGVRARIVAPEAAPRAKLDAVARLGGEIISVPHEVWWQTMVDRRYEGVDGLFVHPVEDDAVMAGNGTIGLELVEDLPDLDAVVVPWGGGGLTSLRRRRRSPLRSRPASRPRSSSIPRSSTAPAAARCCRRCGIAHASSSTPQRQFRSTRSRSRWACSPHGRASSPRARVRSLWRRRCAATPARARWSAS